MPPLTGFLATLPSDVLLDSGVLYINSDAPFGVSRGGLAFDPAISYENIDFDDKRFPIEGLDRKEGGTPKISGTVIELSVARMLQLEPGSTQAGASADVTVTPKIASELLQVGDYLTNVRVVYRRGSGKFAIVKFPIGLITKWSTKGQSKGQVEIAIEIEARNNTDTGDAPYEIHLADSMITAAPLTPEALVAAVNAAGTAQSTHAWAPGRGHTLTLGRKTDIADFVGGGADGVLHLVSSFVGANGAGIKYDPAAPDRFLFDTSSMKVVAPADLGLAAGGAAASRSWGFIGLRNNDTSYFLQSHDGAGAHAWSWDYDGSSFAIAPLPGGNPSTAKTTGVPTDAQVYHCLLQYDAVGDGANAEIQGIVGRDARCWAGMGQAGSTVGLAGARTLEVGNFFGGAAGNNLTGDFRLLYIVAGGTLNRAQLKLLNDYAEQRAGAYIDIRDYLAFSGNSIVAVGVGQWAKQTRDLLGATWIVLDLGVPGYTWTDLTNRAPRVEALLDFTNRAKPICAFHEYTNTVNLITTPDATTFAALSKVAEANVFGATTGRPRKKLLVTMLPTTENYPYNSADGLNFDANVRIPGNALLIADPYFDGVCDAGGDAIMGQYTTLPNATYYSDEVHPTTGVGGGTPILANLLKTAALGM